jgi:hypothetical protein
MDWASDTQRQWLGDEAHSVLERGRLAIMLGQLDAHSVWRCRLHDGSAAWLRLTKNGLIMCVVIAPWDERWKQDTVPADDFFYWQWPKHWRTKAVEVFKLKNPVERDDPFVQDGYCVGLSAKGRTCGLFRVVALDDAGQLVEVQSTEAAPPRRIDAMSSDWRRWWPLDQKFYAGAAKLWAVKFTTAAIYPALCAACSNAEESAMAKHWRRKREAAEAEGKPLPPPKRRAAKPETPPPPVQFAPVPAETPALGSRTIEAVIPPGVRARVLSLRPESDDKAEWIARVNASFGWHDDGTAENLIRRSLAM